MSQRSTSIHILQPCPASWDAMLPAATGRHCAACQKTVVDFTQKTDAEILAYFRQVGDKKPCGRFRAEQLGRPLLPLVRAQRWQLWLASLLLATLALQGCQATTGEVQPTTIRPLPPPPPPPLALTADSTTVGEIEVLLPDSSTASMAPVPACKLTANVLGAPEIR